jgi:hypothetical protein
MGPAGSPLASGDNTEPSVLWPLGATSQSDVEAGCADALSQLDPTTSRSLRVVCRAARDFVDEHTTGLAVHNDREAAALAAAAPRFPSPNQINFFGVRRADFEALPALLHAFRSQLLALVMVSRTYPTCTVDDACICAAAAALRPLARLRRCHLVTCGVSQACGELVAAAAELPDLEVLVQRVHYGGAGAVGRGGGAGHGGAAVVQAQGATLVALFCFWWLLWWLLYRPGCGVVVAARARAHQLEISNYQ